MRVVQISNWDCGPAALLYVLRLMKHTRLDLEDIKSELDNRSVWTQDISHIMALHGVQHVYRSTFIEGSNPAHQSLAFYKGTDSDTARLPQVVAQLQQQHSLVTLAPGHVPADYIIRQLAAKSSLFIALLDMRYMRCCECGWAAPCPESYVGHYVVLESYESSGPYVRYMDPDARARCIQTCAMTVDTLEASRLSAGTDEDLLEIPYDANRVQGHTAAIGAR